MRKFFEVFKTKKPIIGMLHLMGSSPQNIVDNAIEEMKMMTENGVDAVLVENYFGSADDVERVLAVLKRDYPDVLYGVNVLGDIKAAFKLAKRYGAKFIQIDSICGHLTPAEEASFFELIDSLREKCDALLLGGVRFKYQSVCSGRSVEEDLEIGKTHCDAIVVTGEGTGISTDIEKIKKFRKILGDFPLIVGAGMKADTVASQLTFSDGGIVGSYFKYGGDAYDHMDIRRVKRFMKARGEFLLRGDSETKEKARLIYEECKNEPTSGRSGFHAWGGDCGVFSFCGWFYSDDEYGVAFRINKDCFGERDPLLYYMDDDYFGELNEWGKNRIKKMREIIESHSSGLADIRIVEYEEKEEFRFRGRRYEPEKVTMFQFRLDSSKIRETVDIGGNPVSTYDVGEYIFILPRAGEFFIELGEIENGKRIPLHYDDFCMK